MIGLCVLSDMFTTIQIAGSRNNNLIVSILIIDDNQYTNVSFSSSPFISLITAVLFRHLNCL